MLLNKFHMAVDHLKVNIYFVLLPNQIWSEASERLFKLIFKGYISWPQKSFHLVPPGLAGYPVPARRTNHTVNTNWEKGKYRVIAVKVEIFTTPLSYTQVARSNETNEIFERRTAAIQFRLLKSCNYTRSKVEKSKFGFYLSSKSRSQSTASSEDAPCSIKLAISIKCKYQYLTNFLIW